MKKSVKEWMIKRHTALRVRLVMKKTPSAALWASVEVERKHQERPNFVIVDGMERTTYMNIENTFLASVLSFIGQKPAIEYIRALTDGKLSLISRANLQRLIAEVPGFKDFYIALLEHTVCGLDSSRNDLIVLSGEERYAKMLREEPYLIQQIPLLYLASMLGVTPRHLSRIRGQVR